MPEWDEHAQGWDDNPAVRAYADAAYVSLCSRADSIGFAIDGTAACDFGCGTGLLTEHLAARCSIVEAIDSSAAMLDVLGAKITREAWVNVRVLAELPEAGPRYDLVVCSSVLAFVNDYAGTVRELVSRMKPGALFVQWDWELNPADDEPFGLAPSNIGAALRGAGLADVQVGVGFELPAGGETMRPLMGSGQLPADSSSP